VERRLAAILAADVVGYSRLIRADEEGTLASLSAIRKDLIDPKITEHHGRIVKLMGDGMLVEFASVVDAVHAAVETQQAVIDHNSDVPADKRIEFRIGINLGDVVIDGDDIQGDGVNVAARLEGMAEPGGICVSGMVYEGVRDRIDVPFEDLGEQEVKNIDRPVRVWRWLAGDGVTPTRSLGATIPLPLPDKPSIAVLPFENMSGDPEQEYFADGIAEDIVTALSKFRWFFVIARNSSFTYKGKSVDVKQVAAELGVRYVLEGSVRKAGNRVRISAQLIDANTGLHIWADRYDRGLDDIFALQDEITDNVVSAVIPVLDVAEQQRSARKVPENMDAWDCYQRGMWHLNRFSRDDLANAERLFRRAMDLDPRSTLGFNGLAWLGAISITFLLLDPKSDAMNDAYQAARTSVALDDLDAFAHVALGWHATLRKEASLAESEFRRAIDLTPSLSSAHTGLGAILTYTGRVDEATQEFEVGQRLNPRDPYGIMWKVILASGEFFLGKYEACLATTDVVLASHPRWLGAVSLKAASLSMLGRNDEARTLEAQARRVRPEFRPSELHTLLPFCKDEFFERLRGALDQAGWTWE
jgi:adenylate cyclase